MRVAWTGFGQFQGVEANPSAVLAQRLAALEKKFDDKLRVVQSKLDAKARVIDNLVNIVARDASGELQTLRAVRDELTQAMQA